MNTKKAWRSRHAFFYACLLCSGLSFQASSLALESSAALKSCRLTSHELQQLEAVKVQKLHDGDSLRLTDGRKIRLVGINTPEMYKKPNGLQEPLALEAKQALKALLGEGFYLSTAEQAHDRYGRTLAYTYDKNGYRVEAKLLQKGLGFLVAFGPNLKQLDCLQASQAQAKQYQRGIWQHAYYRPVSSNKLSHRHAGFIRLSGKLISITYSQTSWWLNLEGEAVLRVKTDDQVYFNKASLNALKGSNITVNGWLVDRTSTMKNKKYAPFMLLLKHPSQIEPH